MSKFTLQFTKDELFKALELLLSTTYNDSVDLSEAQWYANSDGGINVFDVTEKPKE